MINTNADGVLQARRAAMDALSRREHSHHELTQKLLSRSLERVDVDVALTELEQEGLLSDARFAESLAHSRIRRGKGPVRIRMDLEERGVSARLIQEALESVEVDWNELAREVLIKRFGDGTPESLKERAKRNRFLHYRGFNGDQIRRAMNES